MRRWLLKAHRWAGLSVGLVLAVMGATGAVLAFEDEIVEGFGGGIVRVPLQGPALALPQLVAAAGPAQSIMLFSEPGRSVRVQLGTVRRYLHPQTGALLPPARAESFVDAVEDVHRRLASGDTGRALTGACVLLLIPLVLAGAWLRWPRPWSWKRWFGFDAQLRGRPLLRALHLATGAWVLPMLLLSALTGPYFAYDWYKAGVHRLAGQPPPQPRKPGPPPTWPEVEAAWAAFGAAVPQWRQVTVRPGKTLAFTYLEPGAAHPRATSRIEIDPAGTVLKHEKFADKPAGAQLVSSMFAIHSGSWLGWPGRIAMLLGALALPLFALSGWLMFLLRGSRAGSAAPRATALASRPDAARTSSPSR